MLFISLQLLLVISKYVHDELLESTFSRHGQMFSTPTSYSEVPGSDLGYSFRQSLQVHAVSVLQIRQRLLPFKSFPIR
jgi:hypothetical protein